MSCGCAGDLNWLLDGLGIQVQHRGINVRIKSGLHQLCLSDSIPTLWIALSADHGVSALPDAAKKLHIPAANLDAAKVEAQINAALTAKFSFHLLPAS